MKRISLILILVAVFIATLIAFNILPNTETKLIAKPQSASTAVTSNAFSLKGYENVHILCAYTPAATDATTTVAIQTAETSSGTFTEVQSENAYDVSEGYLEFELSRDMDKPYFKVIVTPDDSSTPTLLSVIGVFYGKEQRPF